MDCGLVDRRLRAIIEAAVESDGRVVVLTGAGISAESGIPTFRGKQGYWTVGAREYHPQEMATWAMFERQPEAVWQWYLYRRGVCRAALPNPAHLALGDLERALGDRFLLLTQNVDGLHLRAGSSLDRTYQIHGNIDFMRCSAACCPDVHPIPDDLPPAKAKGEPLSEHERALLRCPRCGERSRPHILWFDECYDEEHYRFDSSLRAAGEAALLLVVGTSGATNLPLQVGEQARRRGAALVDVDPEPNPFSALAERSPHGFFARGSAAAWVPAIVAAFPTPPPPRRRPSAPPASA